MQKEVVLLSRHANSNRRSRPLRARDRSVQEAVRPAAARPGRVHHRGGGAGDRSPDRRDLAAHRGGIANRRVLQGRIRARLRASDAEWGNLRGRPEGPRPADAARRHQHAGHGGLACGPADQQRQGALPAGHLRHQPGGGAERGRRAEQHSLRERRRRGHRDLQARVQVGVRAARAGRAPGGVGDEVGRRRAAGRQDPEAREHRAALGEHLAREGLPQGGHRVRGQDQGVQGGGRRVVRAEWQGLQRAARTGEGGAGRPVPRRRAPARLHHHAAAVRHLRPLPQGHQLRGARKREAGCGGVGQEERGVCHQRRLVEPVARRQESRGEEVRRGLQGQVWGAEPRMVPGARLRDRALSLHRHRAGRVHRSEGRPGEARGDEDPLAPAGRRADLPEGIRPAVARAVRGAAEHARRDRAHRRAAGLGDGEGNCTEPQLREIVVERFADLLIAAVLLAGLYSTMAYGLGLIYGVLRIVNLNHGGMIMAGAYAGWYLHHALGIDPYLSLLPVAAVSFGVGVLVYRLLVRRLPRGAAGGVQSLLLLFGVWLMVRNAAYLLFTGNDQTLRTSYATRALSVGSALISVNRIAVFGVAVAILIALHLLLTRTYVGKAIRAVAQNPDSCTLVGIPVERIYALTFGLGTALAAAAGLLGATLFPFNPSFGAAELLKSFVVVVLGGLGSVAGTAIAALILAVVEVFAILVIPAYLTTAVGFVLLVLVLVVRPGGLFGQRVLG